MTQPLCRKNKYGHCMFGEKCRYRHNIVICVENNCNVFKCEKRLPKDLDSLNYKCTSCEKIFANLTEVRAHIEDKHLKDTYLTIMYIKQNRVDSEVINAKEHYAKEIFPELARKISDTKFTS